MGKIIEEKEYIKLILKDIDDERSLMFVVKYLEAVKQRNLCEVTYNG